MGPTQFSRRLAAIAVASAFGLAPALSHAQASTSSVTATPTLFRVVIHDLKATVALAASPSTLAFGGVNVGQSASANVTVSNQGGGTASGMLYTLSPSSSAFTLGGGCGSSLGPGASCNETVSFTPTAGQAYSGLLTISGGGQSSTVSLSGTGLLAQDQVSTNSLNFGNQTVGTTSAAQAVVLSNPGNTSLSISQIYTTGNYAAAQSCGSSLAAGGNCSINVTFTPTTVNSNPGDLYVVTGSGTQTVALTGNGQEAILAASPTSVAFGNINNGSSSTQTVTLTNSGNIAATSLAVAAPSGYTTTNTCSGTLAANSSCSVSVTFSPTTSTTYSGNVQVTSSAPALTIPVSGTGVCAGGSQLFTASGTFTPVAGCSTYLVLAVGGGGAGGYTSTPTFREAGGGSGYVNVQYDNGITSSVAVTVGAGSAAGSGTTGGSSCFGSICAAGGYTLTASSQSSNGGSGGADSSNGAATGGTGGGNSSDGFGKGQGAWASSIALFKRTAVTSGAGGATVATSGSLSGYAGGGGGGILIGGTGTSGATGSGGGTGGAGYGGGGGGPAVNSRGATYQLYDYYGAGGNGVVYVEWSQ